MEDSEEIRERRALREKIFARHFVLVRLLDQDHGIGVPDALSESLCDCVRTVMLEHGYERLAVPNWRRIWTDKDSVVEFLELMRPWYKKDDPGGKERADENMVRDILKT